HILLSKTNRAKETSRLRSVRQPLISFREAASIPTNTTPSTLENQKNGAADIFLKYFKEFSHFLPKKIRYQNRWLDPSKTKGGLRPPFVGHFVVLASGKACSHPPPSAL
ncbi:hypothetical protein OQ496_10535, partial [Acetobacter suratthaniensis]|uniref:hypothetical protein n=1 Tax=Acetobacter suratthaniensis TaxID=1502841 RepID=UPI0022457BE9